MKYAFQIQLFISLILIILLAIFISCNEEEDPAVIEQIETSDNFKNFTDDTCEDKRDTIAGIGPTLPKAKLDWEENARVSCYAACINQPCEDENKSCLLRNDRPIGQGRTERIPNPDNPTGDPWFKFTRVVICKCDCGKCSGQKLVGHRISSSGENQNAAINDARAQARTWCKEVGCPPIKGCPEGRICQSKSSSIKVITSELNTLTQMYEVDALVIKCKCACVKSE